MEQGLAQDDDPEDDAPDGDASAGDASGVETDGAGRAKAAWLWPLEPPWPVITLLGVLIAVFAVETLFGVGAFVDQYGFRPSDLAQGHVATLFTGLLVHGGWPHLLVNALFILVCGGPVARAFGSSLGGAAAFYGFIVVCGVLASLGFAALNPAATDPVVGVSGAASGLLAAACGLLGRDAGLRRVTRIAVLIFALAWVGLNLAVGWGGGFRFLGAAASPFAGQVHLSGFIAGLALLAPALWLTRRRSITA